MILESHPVQYRTPVYRELAKLIDDNLLVVFATDCSVRGYRDREFNRELAWDVPLLDGFRSLVLNNERGTPLRGARSLHAKGVVRLLRELRPMAVLFTQFAYEIEWVAYCACKLLEIPVWLRTETQDAAFRRSQFKAFWRGVIYRGIYRGVARAFAIGELNRQHLIRHGVDSTRIRFSRYCTPTRVGLQPPHEQHVIRHEVRRRIGCDAHTRVLSFFGKLIDKKNPALLLDAWLALPRNEQSKTRLLFVGEGELRKSLEGRSRVEKIPAFFAGFINQAELGDYYLASDVVMLPSRRMGETWGLVVNEALDAGCAVIVSDAAGSAVEFGTWRYVRVVSERGGADEVASAIMTLPPTRPGRKWCESEMRGYSIEAAAEVIAAAYHEEHAMLKEVGSSKVR